MQLFAMLFALFVLSEETPSLGPEVSPGLILVRGVTRVNPSQRCHPG